MSTEDRLIEQAAHNGRYLRDRLACCLNTYDIVGDVRDLGLIQAVDLVRDRTEGAEPASGSEDRLPRKIVCSDSSPRRALSPVT